MARELRLVGNEGNPNKVGDFNQAVKIGDALQLGAQTVAGAVSSDEIVLPETAKALVVISAWSAAGTLTGALTPVTTGAPTTGQVSVDRLGNIVFAAADAITEAEVVYTVIEGPVVEASASIVGGSLVLPNSNKARLLLSATSDGNSRLVVARGVAPSAAQAAVSTDGTTIEFNAADNGTIGVARYVQLPEVSVSDALVSTVDF